MCQGIYDQLVGYLHPHHLLSDPHLLQHRNARHAASTRTFGTKALQPAKRCLSLQATFEDMLRLSSWYLPSNQQSHRKCQFVMANSGKIGVFLSLGMLVYPIWFGQIVIIIITKPEFSGDLGRIPLQSPPCKTGWPTDRRYNLSRTNLHTTTPWEYVGTESHEEVKPQIHLFGTPKEEGGKTYILFDRSLTELVWLQKNPAK